MAVVQNNDEGSQTCELPGCDNPIDQSSGSGPPRKYCCSEHRREARRVRYEAKTAASSKPQFLHSTEQLGAPETKPSGIPERPPTAERRNGPGGRRGTRAALTLAGISALVAALIPGDAGTRLPTADREQSPNRSNGRQQAAAVDTTWVPRAKKVLAQVNADLSQIGKAERAAAAAPRDQWSARLRALMQRLEQRKTDLLRLRALLQADLSVVETYDRAAAGLAGTRQQLRLLNQARGSLRALSDVSKEQLPGA